MTDEDALKEIDRQEKRFAAAGFGNGLRLAKSAREYYQTIVKCRQKSAEVAAEVKEMFWRMMRDELW